MVAEGDEENVSQNIKKCRASHRGSSGSERMFCADCNGRKINGVFGGYLSLDKTILSRIQAENSHRSAQQTIENNCCGIQ